MLDIPTSEKGLTMSTKPIHPNDAFLEELFREASILTKYDIYYELMRQPDKEVCFFVDLPEKPWECTLKLEHVLHHATLVDIGLDRSELVGDRREYAVKTTATEFLIEAGSDPDAGAGAIHCLLWLMMESEFGPFIVAGQIDAFGMKVKPNQKGVWEFMPFIVPPKKARASNDNDPVVKRQHK
ncbi:MAG: hypothetical protein ACM3W4_02985 [Ignavibacteriales bacterium]